MRYLLFTAALIISAFAGAQNINADCAQAIPLCSTPNFTFNSTSGVGNVNDIPSSANVSNPSTNPGSTNSGCLLAGELKPQWLLITIGNTGFLEFVFGAANSANPQVGFYDWAMWPYSPTACADIQNNLLAPVRCNWNGSSTGGTGIASSSNMPAGGSSSNYEPPLAVQACQQFIICISNYSGVNTLVSFQSLGTASLSCDPNCLSVTSPTICGGNSASIVASSSGTLTNLSYSINPGGFTSATPTFVVNPPATTSYTIYATGLNSFSVPVTQTAVSTVYVKTQPTVNPTFTNSSCTNTFSAINLNLSFFPANPAPTYTVLWSPTPNGITSPTQTSVGGFISSGPYSATVIAQGGCSVVTNFTMNPTPEPAIISLSPTGPVYSITCYQPTVSITAANSTYNYTWTNGQIASIYSYTADFTFMGVGTWTITAENPVSGCISTKTITIGINTVTPVSALTPTFQSINCNISSITNVTISAGNPTVNIRHEVLSPYGGSVISTNVNLTYFPGGVGEFTHYLVNEVNGCSVAKIFTVSSSLGFPTFSLTSSPLGFTLGCNSKSLTVVNITSGNTTPPGGAVSYTLLSPSASSVTPPGALSGTSTYTVTSPGTWTAITKDNVSFCETRVPFTVLSNTFAPPIDSMVIPTQILNCDVPAVLLKGISLKPNVSYNWSFPGVPGNLPQDSIAVYANFSNRTQTLVANYTLTITDNNSTCRNTTIVPIYQNIYVPKALISNGGTPSLTCKTNTIMLSNASSSGILSDFFPKNLPVIADRWDGPPPQQPEFQTSTYLAHYPGAYTMTAKDMNNGCMSQTVLSVFEDRLFPLVNFPEPPKPAVLDCGALSAAVIPVITTPTANLSYSWTAAPGATVSGEKTPTLIASSIGDYVVIVTNTLNGCASRSIMKVINGTLTASFEADKVLGFAPLNVTFYNNSTSTTGSGSISTIWTLGNGTTSLTTSVGEMKSRYDAAGLYTVTIFAQKGQCHDTARKLIVVDIPSRLEIPNIFTPNGDGVNDLFFLKTTNLSEISVVIVDRWGHKVFDLVSETGNIEWDGHNQYGKELPEGVYQYVIKATGRDGVDYEQAGTVTLVR
jgi:gliding motility-associated-like protein